MASSEEKFVSYFRRSGYYDSEQKLREFYQSIDDKTLIDQILAKHDFTPERHIDQPNIASFKYSTNASLGVICFLYVNLTVNVPAFNLQYKGQGGGAILGAGAAAGTLLYNNQSDLSDSCDFNLNAGFGVTNVNFIRNGVTYATFVGGGIGFAGLSGGTGSWGPEG